MQNIPYVSHHDSGSKSHNLGEGIFSLDLQKYRRLSLWLGTGYLEARLFVTFLILKVWTFDACRAIIAGGRVINGCLYWANLHLRLAAVTPVSLQSANEWKQTMKRCGECDRLQSVDHSCQTSRNSIDESKYLVLQPIVVPARAYSSSTQSLPLSMPLTLPPFPPLHLARYRVRPHRHIYLD